MRKIAIILGILIVPTISFAAPSISSVGGTFNHGETVTITGSGFGTKSPALPKVWADFENLAPNADAASNPTYSTGNITPNGNPGPVVTTADNPHRNSTKSARFIQYSGGITNNANVQIQVNGATAVFTHHRRKWAHSQFFNKLTNYKIWRLWSEPGNVAIDHTLNYQNFSNPFTYPYSNMHTNSFTSYGLPAAIYMTLGHPPANQWNIEEVQTRKSTINVQDGSFTYWYNGTKYKNITLMNRTTAYPTDYSNLYLENFNHHTANVASGYDVPPEGAYVYYDDVYVDTTWSRVMIGNASTYDACTHREPLIPTTWSPSSITAYFNQGSFSNSQPVYVFVVDSDGNASLGKAITIGGVAASIQPINSSPIPNSPDKLSIN